jgi:hypothetical protein
MIKILFMSANPTDSSSLRLGEEVRSIKERLKLSQMRAKFRFEQEWAVRVSDLQHHLLNHRPHVVHFSGHGTRTGAIILEDADGRTQKVKPRLLASVFSTLRDNIKCVVLNSCYSVTQARAIASTIDCVVGMSRAIDDNSAIQFAASFYQGLGFGRTFQTSYKLGCDQIDLSGLPNADSPRLIFAPGVEAATYTLNISKLQEKSARTNYRDPLIPRRKADQTSSLSTKEFVNYVFSLYESLGYSTSLSMEQRPRQVDFFASKNVAGIGNTIIAVKCISTDGSLSIQETASAISCTNEALQSVDVTRAVIVLSHDISSSIVLPNPSSVRITTLRELENDLFQIDDSLLKFVTDYEGREIFSSYVSLSGREIQSGGPSSGNTSTPYANVDAYVRFLISDSPKTFVSLLGDYGAGKTTLLQRIRYIYTKLYLERVTSLKPLFISLKDFYKHNSLEGLLHESMLKNFDRIIPLAIFWRFLSEGKFLLLLDGFDEMSPQVNHAQRADLMLTLSPLFNSKSKCLLSCRPSYFVSHDEYNEVIASSYMPTPLATTTQMKRGLTNTTQLFDLHAHLNLKFVDQSCGNRIGPAEAVTLFLDAFDEPKIVAFLKTFDAQFHARCDCSWVSVRQFLTNIYDLKDLMSKPIILHMIVETVLGGFIDVKSEALQIGPSSLYDTYTSSNLDRDWHKGQTRQLLSKDERREFAQAIALSMYEHRKLEVSYEEIAHTIRSFRFSSRLARKLGSISPEEIAADLQVCAFLTRDISDSFRFAHKSFMEFFVARFLRVKLQQKDNTRGKSDPRLLAPLPREILYFLGGFGFVDPDFRTLLRTLLDSEQSKSGNDRGNDRLKQNYASALLYSSPEHSSLEIHLCYISDIDITKIRFINSEFMNCSFFRCNWNRTSHLKGLIRECAFEKVAIEQNRYAGTEISCTLKSLEIRECHYANCEARFNGIQRSEFRSCTFKSGSCSVAGKLDFQNTKFEDTAIEYSAFHATELTFANCEFNGCKLEPSFGLIAGNAHPLIGARDCEFIQTRIFAAFIKHDDLQKCRLTECSGIIFVSNIRDANFPKTGFHSVKDKLFVVSEDAYFRKKEVRVLIGARVSKDSDAWLYELLMAFDRAFETSYQTI